MDTRTKHILRNAGAALVAVALLALSFRKVDWEGFVRSLSACRWTLVAVSMTAGILSFYVRALRWNRLIRPFDPGNTVATDFHAVNLGNFSSMVIPYSGELVKCGAVAARSGGRAPFDKVLGTAVLERSWDLLSIFVLIPLVLAAKGGNFVRFFRESVWEPAFGASRLWLLILPGVLIVSGIALVFLHRRIPFLQKIWKPVKGVWEGFGSCLKMKNKGVFLLQTLLIWGLYWLQMVLIAAALPDSTGLDAADCLFLMLLGSVISCLPIPGGFGAYHILIPTAMAVLYGIPADTGGIAFATLAHESQAVGIILLGLISYYERILHTRQSQSD